MKKTRTMLAFMLIFALLVCAIGPIGVMAASDYEDELILTRDDSSPLTNGDYAFDGSTLTIKGSGPYTLRMADGVEMSSNYGVAISSESGVSLTLDGVNISTDDGATLLIDSGAGAVTLTLVGENSLSSAENYAGLQKENSEKLTIGGEGSLTANGGEYGAGIGGGKYGDGNNIKIIGGTVTASGGMYGTGIGGGYYGNGDNITISGGTVTATGGMYGAGIGGGYYGDGSYITISSGTVTASGGNSARAIGNGVGAYCNDNKIQPANCFRFDVDERDGYDGESETDISDWEDNKLTIAFSAALERPTIFSDDGTYFADSISVQITCETAGLQIYYTTDGSKPTVENGTLYTGAVTLTETTVVKAIAARDGGDTSGVSAMTFTKVFAVTFDTGIDGEEPFTAYSDEEGFLSEPIPTRDGYCFAGWFASEEDEYPWEFENDTVTEDMTLTARWEEGELILTRDDGETLTEAEYSYAYGALAISGVGPYTLGMADGVESTYHRVIILDKDGVSLTLNGVNIVSDYAAFCIYSEAGAVTLTLVGENSLIGSDYCAGLQKDNSAKLTIQGTGSLTAIGSDGGAGIGGGEYCDVSNITITGGTVTAIGGYGGAGIGGGYEGCGSNITISGGTVIARGGAYACAIGRGAYYEGDDNINNRLQPQSGVLIDVLERKDFHLDGETDISDWTDRKLTISFDVADNKPIFTPSCYDKFRDSVSVEIYCLTDGAKIYYTTDGTEPTVENGTLYEGAITLTETTTIKAIAVKEGMEDGGVVSATYYKALPITFNMGIEGEALIFDYPDEEGYVTEPEVPEREGYRFLGWFAEKGLEYPWDFEYWTVTEGMSFTARWDKNHLILTRDDGEKLTEEDYYYGDGVLFIMGSGPYTLRMAEGIEVTDHYVEVLNKKGVSLTLNGVSIASSYETAFYIDSDAGAVTLTLKGENSLISGEYYAGLQKENTAKLTIGGDGSLTAQGGFEGAGIGGGYDGDGVNITITGGTVTAIGGYGGAGIGGGNCGNACNIKISGGTVTANGGDNGAGIGGGCFDIGSDITITGGTVTANGGDYGAGIGGGHHSYGENITIIGGTVTAIGGDRASGIGVGGNFSDSNDRNNKISPVAGYEFDVPEKEIIHCDDETDISDWTDRELTISFTAAPNKPTFTPTYNDKFNGSVSVELHCLTDGAEIYYTTDGTEPTVENGIRYEGAITLTETTTIKAIAVKEGMEDGGVVSVTYEKNFTVTVDTGIGGEEPITIYPDEYGYIPEPKTPKREGYRFLGWGVSEYNYEWNFENDIVKEDMTLMAVWEKNQLVLTRDDGEKLTENDYGYVDGVLVIVGSGPYTLSMAEGVESTYNSVVVMSEDGVSLTLNGVNIEAHAAFYIDSDAGAVTLTLKGENSLSSNDYYAGLQKENTAKLTIQGTGSLTAIGGGCGAGIGGGDYGDGSNIEISGGTVTAIGGDYGAGIGGGYEGEGDNITISGGTVNAIGGYCSAGIGGGEDGDGSNITITGGTVNAQGGGCGAGIGGGDYGDGSNIEISGGTVTAIGGDYGAGIGGGYEGEGDNITISGGTVNAIGGYCSAGIGGGEDGDGINFSTGENGSALIVASSISDQSYKTDPATGGIIIDGESGTVYGYPTLTFDFTLANGITLTISEDTTLTIASGVTLTVAEGATLINNGTIIIEGTLILPVGTEVNEALFDGFTGSGSIVVDEKTYSANGVDMGALFANISATLGEDISLTYYIDKGDFETAPRMRFTINSRATVVEGVDDGTQYAYKFTGIAPGWMGDTITAELLDDDNAVIATKGYSVLQYLNKLKGMTKEQLKCTEEKYNALQTLINDLLVYGGAAQVFTNYKTEALVSNGITGSERVPENKADFSLTKDKIHVDFTGATVNFNNINRLKIFFNAENTEGLVIKYKVGDKDAWDGTIDYASDGKGGYVIITEGIRAFDYIEKFTFAAFMEGEEEAGATLTYSINCYAFSMKNNSNKAMAALALATYNYGVSAKAFAEAQ